MNRETWLSRAVELMRPWFADAGYQLPERIHVSVGFPSKGALSRRLQRVGECWKRQVSADNSPQIFINPIVADGSRALDILLHELIHAALPEAGHGAAFGKAARQLGLTGPNKSTIATPELQSRLQDLLDRDLGVYPHPALSPALQDKKQTTRMLKVVCMTDACLQDASDSDKGGRFTVRMTRMWLEKFGAPLCPNCEQRMTPAESEQSE